MRLIEIIVPDGLAAIRPDLQLTQLPRTLAKHPSRSSEPQQEEAVNSLEVTKAFESDGEHYGR
jgi:hypothetical protein